MCLSYHRITLEKTGYIADGYPQVVYAVVVFPQNQTRDDGDIEVTDRIITGNKAFLEFCKIWSDLQEGLYGMIESDVKYIFRGVVYIIEIGRF